MKRYLKQIVLISILITVVLLFFVFDLQQYLTLEYLRSSRSLFLEYYQENPLLTIALYMLVYIGSTAFSLPGAAVLTIAAGAFFGTLWGTVIVSFSSTIGATCAMLISRTLLREYIQNRFREQVHVINDGIEKEGAYYLFTLRLVPVVPFFVINAAMGLTHLKAFTFAWVSQIGMLAGTFVYVNAGSELGKIESLQDVLSPRLLLSFTLLGILPISLKKLLSFIESRRQRSK